MPIDDMSSKEVVVHPSDGSSHTTKFIAVFVILALMVIGEVYTLTQMSAMRRTSTRSSAATCCTTPCAASTRRQKRS